MEVLAAPASRLHRILTHMAPSFSVRRCRKTPCGGRNLVLVDLANVLYWFEAMELADPGARRFGKTKAAMVAICEPRAWRHYENLIRIPWVISAQTRGRLALFQVEAGDESGDLLICSAAAFASTLTNFGHVFVVSDDQHLSHRLQSLHGNAFLTPVLPCGGNNSRNEARGHNVVEWVPSPAVLRPPAEALLQNLSPKTAKNMKLS
jgi:hypothetical protein